MQGKKLIEIYKMYKRINYEIEFAQIKLTEIIEDLPDALAV